MSKASVTPTHLSVKTQKAKGILALRANGIDRLSTTALTHVTVFPHEPLPPYPFFARPCPMVPRHGFVDSRMIHDPEAWAALVKEIAASGETTAEVICMPYLNAQWSAILTPTALTIGPGNDGATSGHGALTIPAIAASRDSFLDSFQVRKTAKQSGITETPFIEMVAADNSIEAVQVRNGPAVSAGHSFVPKAVVVKMIVEAKGDLLLWETLMKKVAGEDGVVVWHPGGCLSSHYAVQAILHQLPVVCMSEAPVVGSVLEASKDGPSPLSDRDYKLLSRLVGTAVRTEIPNANEHSDMIHLAIAALHGQAMWGPERHLLVLRAVGVAYMLRFSVAAVLGELRHWNHSGPGRSGATMTTDLGQFVKGKKKLNRQSVYARAFKKKIMHLADKLPTAQADFLTQGWSGSFGGRKWAKCANVVSQLYAALGAFLKQPRAENWMGVISSWNQAVNVFHNTGAMLNKFISSNVMNALAVCPSYGLISLGVAKLTLEAPAYLEHKIPTKVGKHLGAMPAALPDQKTKAKKKASPSASLPSGVTKVYSVGDLAVLPPMGKGEKPVAVKWAAKMYGTYKDAEGSESISIQIATPIVINKTYGAGTVVVVGKQMKRALMGVLPTTTSLTGSSTPAWSCEFHVTKKANGTLGMTLSVATQGAEAIHVRLEVGDPVIAAVMMGVKEHGQL